MDKKYYNKPTQVKFYDVDNDLWVGGIAYHDEIICGCCGGIQKISELKEDEIIEYTYWVNISDEIKGDWQAGKAYHFFYVHLAGRPRRGRPVIPLPHLIWQFFLVKVDPAYAPLHSRNFAAQERDLQPCGPRMNYPKAPPYGRPESVKRFFI